MAFAARQNEAHLATRESNRGRARTGLADHKLENGGISLDRQPQAVVRRGAGHRLACPTGSCEGAALPTLRSRGEILPRRHEVAAPSLFCADFRKPKGGRVRG